MFEFRDGKKNRGSWRKACIDSMAVGKGSTARDRRREGVKGEVRRRNRMEEEDADEEGDER